MARRSKDLQRWHAVLSFYLYMVHVNTVMIERLLSKPKWQGRLTAE